MGSFSNTLFSALLGWLQGLVSMIWSALTSESGSPFFQFIEKNWLKMIIVLCVAGVAADFIVYIFRWTPYKVWYSFFQRIKSKKPDTVLSDQTEMSEENREETPFRRRNTAEKTGIPGEEEEDDLRRWKETEPAAGGRPV